MRVVNCVSLHKLIYFIGICSFVFFLILALCFDAIMKTQIQLNPHTMFYNMWVRNKIPIYLEIYLFNLTNADDFMKNKTITPNFEEIGPFFFEETREKVNISWDDVQETVTFNQTKKWQLMNELSQDFSVKITNINPIASTIAYISRLWQSELQRKIANALINTHEPLLVTASAQEWTFDGIPDKFLEIFETLREVTEIPIPYNKFGWFYERNGSSTFDGAFTIKTGKSRDRDRGVMAAWNHKNKTDHYADACGLVSGTTGEINPPVNPFQKNLSVFASDICRFYAALVTCYSYITLKYEKAVDFDGINAYEYIGDESVFDNGTSYPENWCFYPGESCPSGSRNVSSCRFGSPAFISFPHFYLADSYYTDKLTGLSPDKNKHKFTLKLEPETGLPLAVDAAFQINFLVEPYAWCDEFQGIPKMHFPMLWFRQTVKLTQGYSTLLKVFLFFQNNGQYFIFSYAFFILLCMLLFYFWKKYKYSSKN